MSSKGYWLPHSSSLDFCEPDYIHSTYYAEIWNAYSSLFITFLAFGGYLYSNPTNETMFSISFLVLAVIGIGSFIFHSTLHWFTESLDEIPMIWFNIVLLYLFLYSGQKEVSFSKDKRRFFIGSTLVITFSYFMFQSIYAIFMIFEILSFITISVWISYLVLIKHSYDIILFKIWIYSISSFILFAAIPWIIDMNLCDTLLPIYLSFPGPLKGVSLHIIWHIAAGYGGLFVVLGLQRVRCNVLEIETKLVWKYFVIPFFVEIKENKLLV